MKNPLMIWALGLVFLILSGCNSTNNRGDKIINSDVKVAGAMKNVMMKGELFGRVDLDTISIKEHLYGLGPVEYLTGEILIVDGKAYSAYVLKDSAMKVKESFKIKAPFLVYANVENWNELNLPDSVESLNQLENYLDEITKTRKRPFAFKLTGNAVSAGIHLVNLAKGSVVHSKEEAHVGEVKYFFKDQSVVLVGFFSTEHKGIFTHHDSFMHVHLITEDRSIMGHLDEIKFKKGAMKLYLPED